MEGHYHIGGTHFDYLFQFLLKDCFIKTFQLMWIKIRIDGLIHFQEHPINIP